MIVQSAVHGKQIIRLKPAGCIVPIEWSDTQATYPDGNVIGFIFWKRLNKKARRSDGPYLLTLIHGIIS